MDLYNWLVKHWPELLAALSLGGGGGIASKKLTDKKQDKKISDLEVKINSLEKDIETNTLFDKQFREQMGENYNGIKEDIRGVNGRLDQILVHLAKK